MPRPKKEELLFSVIKYLEILEYDGMETLEPSWVKSVLLNAGTQRQNLMMWVLWQLCPTEATEVQTLPQQMQQARILETLSSLGICRPGDSDVIEGSAAPVAQYRFWRSCLESIYNIFQLPPLQDDQQSESYKTGSLIDHLAHSPHLQFILKESGVNVIPGDQKDKYHMWLKYGQCPSVADLLKDTDSKLKPLREQYEATDNRWKLESTTEETDQSADLCNSITDLSKQQELLQGVYSTYIAPWTTSTQQLELPNTGPLINEANTKLAALLKVLKATEDASSRCQELGEREKTMSRHSTQPSSIASTLHTLVSQSNVGGN